MIAVDTSALFAIALREPRADDCIRALRTSGRLLISAGTVAEALIVSGRRGFTTQMLALIEQWGLEVVPVTSASARRVAAAYGRWGKGVHPAALNFGDCFAYEVAAARGCSLLFLGKDFGQTDIASTLDPP